VLVAEYNADLQTDPVSLDVFELREGLHGNLDCILEMNQ
jgi:hypothetical protein